MCAFEVLVFAVDRALCVLVYGRIVFWAAGRVLLLVKFGIPSFHFQTKKRKRGSEQDEKKAARQERFGAGGQARGGGLTRLDVATAAHLFSLSRRDPWNRIRRACVKGQHWHTAGCSPPCVRGAPPPLSGIIFCFRKAKKKKKKRKKRLRRRLIGPFIRGEGCQTPRFLRDGNREKDLKWPGGRGGGGGGGDVDPGASDVGRGARIGPRSLPSTGPY